MVDYWNVGQMKTRRNGDSRFDRLTVIGLVRSS
jgi:hypothetical protein